MEHLRKNELVEALQERDFEIQGPISAWPLEDLMATKTNTSPRARRIGNVLLANNQQQDEQVIWGSDTGDPMTEFWMAVPEGGPPNKDICDRADRFNALPFRPGCRRNPSIRGALLALHRRDAGPKAESVDCTSVWMISRRRREMVLRLRSLFDMNAPVESERGIAVLKELSYLRGIEIGPRAATLIKESLQSEEAERFQLLLDPVRNRLGSILDAVCAATKAVSVPPWLETIVRARPQFDQVFDAIKIPPEDAPDIIRGLELLQRLWVKSQESNQIDLVGLLIRMGFWHLKTPEQVAQFRAEYTQMLERMGQQDAQGIMESNIGYCLGYCTARTADQLGKLWFGK